MDAAFRDDLARRLPIPLAQLYRRAHTADSAIERHHAAYYLFEVMLKLLGSAAVAEVQARPDRLAEYEELLARLARPSIGDWREIVERLVPELAKVGDAGFQAVAEVLFGKPRGDFPALSRLDALLREAVDGKASNRTNVRPMDVLALLVRYRNQEIGHGATGLRPASHYARHGAAILDGVLELLERVDPLAGRRLWYVSAISGTATGGHRVDRLDLHGENATRLPVLELPNVESAALPRPGQAYLAPVADSPPAELLGRLHSLHPLVVYDAETREPFLLNAQRGKAKVELLCYTTGEISHRDDLAPAQMEFLQAALHRPVESGEVAAWQAQSIAGDAPPPAATGEPLRRVGEYELVSRIGHGGMGIVYRAWQPLLGRQVAVKCLMRAGDPKAQSRFLREVRALGRVRHPNLVQIHSSGCDGEVWFYAMDLIPGADLATVCENLSGQEVSRLDTVAWKSAVTTACETTRQREHKLAAELPDGLAADSHAETTDPQPAEAVSPQSTAPAYVARAAGLIRQAADAVEALHEAGIIHRDLKPGNIMVSPDGSRATLMDLGLAQFAEAGDKLTKTRQFVGTLRYASPEQVLAAEKVDRRSDVYSLGATLWELLTLRMLFGADDTTPTPKLMNMVAFKPPGSPRAINPAVPPALEAIVLKCLAKDPDDRYATAGALRDDLARYLSGRPVLAEQEQKTRHSKRLLLYAACSAAAVLLAFVAVLAFGRLGDEPSPMLIAGGQTARRIPKAVAPTNDPVPYAGEHSRMITTAPAPAGVRRALLIGTNYPNTADELRFAVADMVDLAEVLNQGGYAEVVLCTDEIGQRPTRNTILSEVERLADACVPGDMLLVAYSGHVQQDQDGQPYIIPAGGDRNDPVGTGVPFSEIVACLERSAASSKVLISDFCSANRTVDSGPAQQIRVDSEEVAILLSAGTGEVALEHASLGHGIFYYHLLKGLRGAANANSDTAVDTQELFEYVRPATVASAEELYKRTSTPQQFGSRAPVSLISAHPSASMALPAAKSIDGEPPSPPDEEPDIQLVTYDVAIAAIAKEFADKLRELNVQSVALAPDYGGAARAGIGRLLATEIQERSIEIKDRSEYAIQYALDDRTGRYRLTATLQRNNGEELHSLRLQINPEVVAAWAGQSFELPASDEPRERRARLEEPKVYVQGDTISPSHISPFRIQLRVTGSDDRPRHVIQDSGQAICEVVYGDSIFITLENQADYFAAVQVAMDGLNLAAFHDSPEFAKSGFLVVPPRSRVEVKGWYLSGNRVEPLKAGGLPAEAPEWLHLPNDKICISAVFRAAWQVGELPPQDEPPANKSVATGRGHDIEQSFATERFQFGVIRAGISILCIVESAR